MWWIDRSSNPYRLTKPATPPAPKTISPLDIFKGHIEIIASLVVHGDTLYSSGYDKMLLDWDLTVRPYLFLLTRQDGNCKHVKSRYLNKRGGVWCMTFSPDGSILYSGGHDRKLMSWNTTVGTSFD